MRFVGAAVVAAVVTVGLLAATHERLPRARLNDACRWTENASASPSPEDPARRAHLIEDVRVAEALGIRYADALTGHGLNTETFQRPLAWCTEASIEAVMRRHAVTRAYVGAVTGARALWIDVLAVFLPVGVLFFFVARLIARRVLAGYDPDDRRVALVVLVVLAPAVAGLAVGAAQWWGNNVEMFRLRDGHLSYRALRLPANEHGWVVWQFALGMFAAAVIPVLFRARPITPSRDGFPLSRE